MMGRMSLLCFGSREETLLASSGSLPVEEVTFPYKTNGEFFFFGVWCVCGGVLLVSFTGLSFSLFISSPYLLFEQLP